MNIHVHKIFSMIYDYVMDLKLGIKTSKYKVLKQNRTIHSNYEPTLYIDLNALFQKHPFSDEDHIIDYGCGKGRVLIVSAQCMCLDITGLEINKDIYDVALKNINRFQKKKKNLSKINIFNIDAKDYKNIDEINKFFFFNPFHFKVFLRVFNMICTTIEKYPRKVTLFFYMPIKSWISHVENSGIFYKFDTLFVKNREPYEDCVGFGFLIYSNYLSSNTYINIAENKNKKLEQEIK